MPIIKDPVTPSAGVVIRFPVATEGFWSGRSRPQPSLDLNKDSRRPSTPLEDVLLIGHPSAASYQLGAERLYVLGLQLAVRLLLADLES